MYLRKIKRPKGIYLAIQESVYDSSSKQNFSWIAMAFLLLLISLLGMNPKNSICFRPSEG